MARSAEFHGYGFGNWGHLPGMYSGGTFRGTSRVKKGDTEGIVGARSAGMVTADSTMSQMGQAGPGRAAAVHTGPVMDYEGGLKRLYQALKSDKKQPRSRQGAFSQTRSLPSSEGGDSLDELGPGPSGPRPLGSITYRPVGPYPGAINTTATRGELGPGPFGLPGGARPMGPGVRPMGPAPGPALALPARSGAVPPTRPRRSRSGAFGGVQLQFGQP